MGSSSLPGPERFTAASYRIGIRGLKPIKNKLFISHNATA